MASDNARWAGWAGRHRPNAETIFLAVLAVILATYTEMALEMEWRTAAGRIGPGVFPRIIGGLGLVLTLTALVRSLSSGAASDDDLAEGAGDTHAGRHPWVMVLVMLASFGLLAVFLTLGSIVACALFLAATLWLLNRGHGLLNTLVSLGLPVAIYLLFQTFLNAGLPNGILPRF